MINRLSKTKAFTLLEVLVVLLLVSLIFTVVFSVFRSTGIGALSLTKDAEALKQKAFLKYRLKHQLEGLIRDFELKKEEDGEIYLSFVTSVGEVYSGVVQVYYRFADNKLFYCEKPFQNVEADFISAHNISGGDKPLLYRVFQNSFSCEKKEYVVGNFNKFKVRVFYRGRWYSEEESFRGKPEKVEITLDNTKLIAIVRVGQVYP